MNTKLIIVEGIPGSGKTSTAKNIKKILDSQNIKNHLFLEGDVNHPADYESAACVDKETYANLLEKFNHMQEVIKQHTEILGSDHIIYYGSLNNENPALEPSEFMNALQRYEIYNLPLEKHQKLITDKWNQFADKVKQTDGIFILENCFLQNPLVITFGRYNEPRDQIINYIKTLEKLIKTLTPKLIYFHQNDVGKTIRRVMKERPKEWLEHGINYYTEQGFGKENGFVGVDGLIEVLKERKVLELEILGKLDIESLAINNSSFEWENILNEVEDYIINADKE